MMLGWLSKLRQRNRRWDSPPSPVSHRRHQIGARAPVLQLHTAQNHPGALNLQLRMSGQCSQAEGRKSTFPSLAREATSEC